MMSIYRPYDQKPEIARNILPRQLQPFMARPEPLPSAIRSAAAIELRKSRNADNLIEAARFKRRGAALKALAGNASWLRGEKPRGRVRAIVRNCP